VNPGHGAGISVADNEPSSAAFHLGQGARIGKVDVRGNVAGRDVVVGTTAADAEAAEDRQQLLALVLRLQEQVAALQEAPQGLKEDAADELRKAHEAGQQGDAGRLTEKLDTARGYLERIGQTLPSALALAQAIAAVAARAAGLF
jgi:hypothetical protein